jgi:hypothetical protein
MNQWRLIDFDEFEGESLGDAINRMRSKPYTYAEHYAPHDIAVRELGSGKTRLEIAETHGVTYNIVPMTPIQDGINAVKMRFPTLYFDKDKTKVFRKKIAKYHKQFDEVRGVWKDKPYHDANSHAADTLRSWAMTDVPMVSKRAVQSIERARANKHNSE